MLSQEHITLVKVSAEQYRHIKRQYDRNLAHINTYIEQLQWWNKRVNLVSRDVSRETLVMHVEHSLLLRLVSVVNEAPVLLDVGTGGGLPGIPLAICRQGDSIQRIIMNDKVEKKIWAIKQMIHKMGIKGVEALSKNASQLSPKDTTDVSWEVTEASQSTICVTKHAFKVAQLLDLISPKLTNEFVFLKGHTEAVDEIKKLSFPVKAVIYTLDGINETSFYDGKAIVHISR